jgi:hypothetical protein
MRKPRVVAMFTACVRSDALSFSRIFFICAFTAASEMERCEAIILLDVPRATSRSTSISRSLRSSSAYCSSSSAAIGDKNETRANSICQIPPGCLRETLFARLRNWFGRRRQE